MSGSFRRGGQLLLLVLAYYLLAWFYVVALWFERLKFLRDLQIVVAAGFLALWLPGAYHRVQPHPSAVDDPSMIFIPHSLPWPRYW